MNPFRYTEPVPVAELLDRDVETELLLSHADEGNNSRLVAPRRYGKTSLLRRVVHDGRKAGWATVYVDFFGVLTLADIAQRIERAYAEQLEGRLASWFSGVRRRLKPVLRAGGGTLPAAVEIGLSAQAEPGLLERLALPRLLHERHGKRTLVVLDEFQDVLAAKDRADVTIRSEIQHHGNAASYVFAGSQVGMMRQLFSDRRRAFYGQTIQVELPPLPSDRVADYLAARFAEGDRNIGSALDPLLEVAQGHPQRTMLLAHVLWNLTPAGTTANEETWQRTYDAVMNETGDELRASWTALAPGQRRALTTIAEKGSLYSSDLQHGGSRGGAVRKAVQALEDRGEITADPAARPGFRVVDPLLSAWIAEGRLGS